MSPLRRCPKCGQEKPETAAYFRPSERCKAGLRPVCRVCTNASSHGAANDRPETQALPAARPPERTPSTPKATPAYVPTIGAPQRIVCFFDLHWGDHDPEFWRCVIAWLRENPVNEVVLGGDVLDLESASSHGGNADQPFFTEDIEGAKAKLRELKATIGDARISFLEGNHETRLGRMVAQAAPTLFGALVLPEALCLAEMGITWVGEGSQPIRRGPLKVLHGHQLTSPGQLVAKRLVDVYAGPGETVACGHFHRASNFTKPMHGGSARGHVFGCGRTLDPKWQHGTVNGWSHEFGVFDVLPSGRVFTHRVEVVGGQCIWGDRLYSGAA